MLLCEVPLDISHNSMVKRTNDVSDVVYDSVDAHHRGRAFAMMLNRVAYD